MSNVLTFDQAETPPTTAQLRLRRLSRALSILFLVSMIATVLSVVTWSVMGLFFANHMSVAPEGVYVSFPHPAQPMPGRVLFSSQPFITHLAGFIDIILASLPAFFICWHLRGLFKLYANGVVFARENAAHLKRVGLWLLLYPPARFIANMIFRLAGGTDKAWFRGELIDALILGAIVFAIAQVMEFGHEIELDRSEII